MVVDCYHKQGERREKHWVVESWDGHATILYYTPVNSSTEVKGKTFKALLVEMGRVQIEFSKQSDGIAYVSRLSSGICIK
jgi:hypothetical protein